MFADTAAVAERAARNERRIMVLIYFVMGMQARMKPRTFLWTHSTHSWAHRAS